MSVVEDKIDGRTLRHQHRRPELLAAAVEYVLEHGIADLSLRPMAEELGVSHSTLLRHFGTKEELVTEVIEHVRAGIFSAPRASAGDASVTQSFRAVWKRLCDPAERRQFLLLFEVVAVQGRDPDRFTSLEPTLITEFLGPVEASLRNLGTDYVDIYNLHGVSAADYPMLREEVLPTFFDLRDEGNAYSVRMDVPGADKGAVDVTFEDGLLRVRAGAALDERPGFATRLAEFEIADYERAFRVTESVDTDAIAAELKHGVLSIRVPKARPSRRRVEVTAS